MVVREIRLPPNETSDLGSLWSKAVREYERTTNANLPQMGKQTTTDTAKNIGRILEEIEEKKEGFSMRRHKQDRADKAREAIGKHLDAMQKCLDGVQMVGSAAAIFPPAMPVSIVFAACGRVLDAFKGVQNDLNKIEEFLSLSSRFFERLSIIEGYDCDDGPLGKAIVHVFSAQLSMYTFVQGVLSEGKGRIKMFFDALWELEDPKLVEAYAVMQSAIEDLDKTLQFANHAAIKNTHDVAVHISEGTDKLDRRIRAWREEQNQDVLQIFKDSLEIRMQLQLNHTVTMKRLDTVLEAIAKASARSKKDTESVMPTNELNVLERHKEPKRPSGPSDVMDKRYRVLEPIRAFFDSNNSFSNWYVAQKENLRLHSEFRTDFVEGTCEWIFADSAWTKWTGGENPLFWLRGTDGIGKSFLSFSSIRKLNASTDGSITVYFHFREELASLRSIQNAFASMAYQIAEANQRYARYIGTKLSDANEKSKDITPWQRFFVSAFRENRDESEVKAFPDSKLYMVFDGLDELPPEQRQVFELFIADIMREKSRIRILVLSRIDQTFLEQHDPIVLDITKERVRQDISLFVRNGLNSGIYPTLKRFSRNAKQAIRRKITKQADGMLYASHMLRRLSYIGLEGAVMKDLEQMPCNLTDSYRCILEECFRGRTEEQKEALRKLFAWLTFAKRPLSLLEACNAVELTAGEPQLDLEDEIVGKSARILELLPLSNVEYDDQEGDDDDNEDHINDLATPSDDYRKSSLIFRERSLRQYFRAVEDNADVEKNLRATARFAHVTIMTTCVDIMRKAAIDTRKSLPPLVMYAVTYWYDHFHELDPSKATALEIQAVVSSLHTILTDESRIGRVIDNYAKYWEFFPEAMDGEPAPWYGKVHAWVSKATETPISDLSPTIKSWATEFSEGKDHVLSPLCRTYISSWLNGRAGTRIFKVYWFANAVAKICGVIPKTSDNNVDDLMKMVTYVGATLDSRAKRAIGITSFWTVTKEIPEERQLQIRKPALFYLVDSLEVSKLDTPQYGCSLYDLAKMYMELNNRQKAVEEIDATIETFTSYNRKIQESPEPPIRDFYLWTDSQQVKLWDLHLTKAIWLLKSDDKSSAFPSYERFRVVVREELKTSDTSVVGWVLEDIASIFEADEDPDGHRFMQVLKSWNKRERHTWLDYNLRAFADLRCLGRMFRAAVLTNETELVLGWLDAFEKTLTPKSFIKFNLYYALGDFCNNNVGNLEKAKSALGTAMRMQPTIDPKHEEDFNSAFAKIRLQLAGIIFTQFSTTPDPERKEVLIEEMRYLPGTAGGETSFSQSHVGMLFANMLLIMGPAREYQKYMNEIFEKCVNGLADSDPWNDPAALRLLAKVLSSLEGLEKDAQIALSAQFSMLDKNVQAASKQNTPDAPDTADTTMQSSLTSTPVIEDSGNAEQNLTKVPVDNRSEETVNEGSPVEHDETADFSADDAEDLIDDGGYWCDVCDAGQVSWQKPFYLCLICPDVDLCESCLQDKRAESAEQDQKRSWTLYCDPKHKYLKGPVSGWKGIKDGSIRIEGEDPFTVREWLAGLQSERWPKAWERYWLRQAGFKDIFTVN
ncbi:unnamed protein product [Periconia digitata]|uniref:NACHT domain-containing protein n=1 Tax=Periconia digitata TaxID=1303443 RepID=A0A9W4XKQ8_9PLEO|nr:unnamed protein product [Periconia digitata]